ncbi:MAG: hypothetical protein HYY20_06540 [Candidatus Tectomicrobia bacterium]|uniref:Uncharacterized protein n=1 Tax=Tectimicrobiota bacterium TaxID=2528274 RepID=A0A932FWN0_UNCTE|nr:hypothetical protein [Candidatus Tectomicrobia bacterium]
MKQRLFKKDYHKLQEELDELQKRLREAEEERLAFEGMIRDQAVEIEKQEMALQAAQERLIAQGDRLAAAQSDQERLRASLCAIQTEYDQAVQVLETQLSEERAEKARREEEIRGLQGRLQASQSRMGVLQDEVARLTKDLDRLQRDKERSTGIARDAQQQVEALSTALEEASAARNQLFQELHCLREALAREEAKSGRLQERIGQIEGQLRQLQEEKEELEGRIRPLIVRLAVWLSGNRGPGAH